MTNETVKKLYKHFSILADGDFNERTFDFELIAKKDEDSGSTHVGKMSQARRNLIQGDALRNKLMLEAKFPGLVKPQEKPKEEIKTKGKK